MINEEEDFSEEDFREGDYGFIIDPEGNLKSMMFPEDLMEDPPKTIRKILKIFGITDINVVTEKTLH